MSNAIATIQLVSNLLYLMLALVAVRLWWRHRQVRAAAWVAGTFAAGGLVVAISLVVGEATAEAPWPLPLTKFVVLLLVALPVCLHEFVVSMEHRATATVRGLRVVAGVLAVATLALPRFAGPDEEPTGAMLAYVLAFVVVWLLLNARAAWVLISAAKGQPGVIRRRLQVLASGALGLGLAVALPAFAADDGMLAMLGGIAGALSGALFLVGFEPPGLLRAKWREREEVELHEATKHLMLAAHRDDVARTLLPCMNALIGARASALVDADGRVVGREGDAPTDVVVAGDVDGVLTVPVAGRQKVLLWTSPWSPLLGQDERRLVSRLTALSDLALDRAELFEAEQRARAEAERANREVESFVATITHDLRNPLTTIGGMADLLLGPLNDDLSERTTQFIERIRSNTTYMGALVDDILALAEVGNRPAKVEPVDLDGVANQVAVEVGMRQPLATVEVHDLPVVLGDPVRLRRLFENLIGNSLKHSGREDVRIDVSAVIQDGWLEVRILDNGRGIPPESSEQVFGLFERLDGGRSKGSGLGLAICRRLVESVGGSMWFATSSAGADLRMRVPDHLVVNQPVGEDEPADQGREQATASLEDTAQADVG